MPTAVLDVRTLEEGAQTAESVGDALVAWLAPARASLDLALYDVRLPGPVGDAVADALRGALARGVRVRIAFNDDAPGPDERPFEPPPPSTEPHRLEALGAELKAIPGWRDLMHHKYVVRDGAAVWTGSTTTGGKDITRRRTIWWLATTKSIWQFRNDLVFHNQAFDIHKLVDNSIFLTWTWLKGWEKNFCVPFHHWSSAMPLAFV